MAWSCNPLDEMIEVYKGTTLEGRYKLLKEPYCKKCARPNITTDECTYHHSLNSVDRIYAMGYYIKVHRATKVSLLSRHILKAKQDPSFIEPVAIGMVLTAQKRYPELLDCDYIVPVPLHTNKLGRRGYNQSLKLSEIMSSKLGKKVLDILEKTRDKDFQGLSWIERNIAAIGLYRMKNQSHTLYNKIEDKNILVVDDVITTGTTADTCAKILKEDGALIVNVFAAARTMGEDHVS